MPPKDKPSNVLPLIQPAVAVPNAQHCDYDLANLPIVPKDKPKSKHEDWMDGLDAQGKAEVKRREQFLGHHTMYALQYHIKQEYDNAIEECLNHGARCALVEIDNELDEQDQECDHHRHPRGKRFFARVDATTCDKTLWCKSDSKVWKECLHEGIFEERAIEFHKKVLRGEICQSRLDPVTNKEGFISAFVAANDSKNFRAFVNGGFWMGERKQLLKDYKEAQKAEKGGQQMGSPQLVFKVASGATFNNYNYFNSPPPPGS